MPILSNIAGQSAKKKLASRVSAIYSFNTDSRNVAYSDTLGDSWIETVFNKALTTGANYVTWGNGLFVASSGYTASISTDGLTWTVNNNPNAYEGQWGYVYFGNGKFIWVERQWYGGGGGEFGEGESVGSNRILVSTNAVNWTMNYLNYSEYWSSLAYGNGTYVLTGTSFLNAVQVSTDAVSWSTQYMPSNAYYDHVTFGNGVFIAIGYESVARSTNGVTWTQSAISPQYKHPVAFGNGVMLSIKTGSGTSVGYRSTDGITWTTVNPPGDPLNGYSNPVFFNGSFRIKGSTSSVAARSTDGITWTLSTGYTSNYYSTLAANSQKIVGIDNTYNTFDSTDGISWVGPEVVLGGAMPENASWKKVIHGNGKYVAIRNTFTNKLETSTNGISWTTVTLPVSANFFDITFGAGTFVAVENNTNIAVTSTNAITWTQRTMPSNNWYSVEYGDDKFVATGIQNKLAYSTDLGATWIGAQYDVSLPLDTTWRVGGGGSATVAVPLSASTTVSAYTTNGTTWTTGTLPGLNNWSVGFGNGFFVATGQSGVQSAHSTNGTTWGAATLPASGNWTKPVYGAGLFITARAFGSNLAYSTNGAGWTSTSVASTSGGWWAAAFGTRFVLIQQTGTQYATSENGINWTIRTLPVNASPRAVSFGNSVYVITTLDNRYVTSTDGITWTQRTLPISQVSNSYLAFGNGRFALIKQDGNDAAHSTDAITWTTVTLPEFGTYTDLSFDGSRFIATQQSSSSYLRSTDGITWVKRVLTSGTELPGNIAWTSIAYGNGNFVSAASNGSSYAMSTNGISWTRTTLPVSRQNGLPLAGNGIFVTPSANSSTAYATSTNGISWTERVLSAAGGIWSYNSFSNGLFILGGTSSSNFYKSTDGINWSGLPVPQPSQSTIRYLEIGTVEI